MVLAVYLDVEPRWLYLLHVGYALLKYSCGVHVGAGAKLGPCLGVRGFP